MRRTKIIATIGPASEKPEVLVRLIEAGMNVARLNFSHGELSEHGRRIEAVRKAAAEAGKPVGIMLDLKGPEIRIGKFIDGRVLLKEGDPFTLTVEPRDGDQTGVLVQYPHLAEDVQRGQTLLLDDGNIALEVLEVSHPNVHCRVVVGGPLSDRKKLNLPGVSVKLPALSEKDINDIRFGVQMGVDFIAASFVRKATDIIEIRKILEEAGGDQQIIAKVENQEGYQNLEAILKVADGLMVARGDLGVEFPAEEVPIMQKKMIQRANQLGKPVITATQMLESMITKPRPTRAEASDVANAIFDGSDAIMLSGETAVGQFPVDSVATMAKIAQRTERALEYATILAQKSISPLRTVTDAISHATVTTAQDLGAAAIITATRSGYTARMVSKYRPQAPVIAVTPDRSVARTLSLVWGVTTVVKGEATSTDEMIDRAVEGALQAGLIKNGDLVVITAGVPVGIQGTTNLIKVHTVGDVLIRGVGIGQRAATGRARVARTPRELEAFELGDILVTIGTDLDFMPFVEMASAVVAEEGGLTSHAAIVGLNLGIPVIVGAEGATGIITDGTIITVDGSHGLVYRGQATVK